MTMSSTKFAEMSTYIVRRKTSTERIEVEIEVTLEQRHQYGSNLLYVPKERFHLSAKNAKKLGFYESLPSANKASVTPIGPVRQQY